MIISNEPLVEGEAVKFKVKGFPAEEAIKGAVERFYKLKADAKKDFLVHNEFGEVIFTGQMDENGKVYSFTDAGKPSKTFPPDKK